MEYRLFTIVRYNYRYRDYNTDTTCYLLQVVYKGVGLSTQTAKSGRLAYFFKLHVARCKDATIQYNIIIYYNNIVILLY
jgi:hypothetical protein